MAAPRKNPTMVAKVGNYAAPVESDVDPDMGGTMGQRGKATPPDATEAAFIADRKKKGKDAIPAISRARKANKQPPVWGE